MCKLDKISQINSRAVGSFASIGIYTVDDLLKAGHTDAARRDLAARLRVTSRIVTRWVHYADLVRVPGIGDDYALLLTTAQVSNVNELSQCSAETLRHKLNDINRFRRLVRRIPSVTQLDEWIRTARTLPKLVHA